RLICAIEAALVLLEASGARLVGIFLLRRAERRCACLPARAGRLTEARVERAVVVVRAARIRLVATVRAGEHVRCRAAGSSTTLWSWSALRIASTRVAATRITSAARWELASCLRRKLSSLHSIRRARVGVFLGELIARRAGRRPRAAC